MIGSNAMAIDSEGVIEEVPPLPSQKPKQKGGSKPKTRVISSAISLDLHMRLRMEAARLDMTLSDYIRHLLDKELKGGK